jgi:hypothetical protein
MCHVGEIAPSDTNWQNTNKTQFDTNNDVARRTLGNRAIAQSQDARNRVAAVRSLPKEASLQRLALGDGTPSEHDLSPGSLGNAFDIMESGTFIF